MLKEIILPPLALSHLIRCYWTIVTPLDVTYAQGKFRILSDGYPEMIIHFGTPPRRKIGGTDDVEQTPQYIIGLFSQYVDYQLCGHTQTLLVKFHPWALSWLLGDDAHHATDHQLNIYDLVKPQDASHFQEMLASGSPSAAIPLIEAWLLSRQAPFVQDLQVAHAVELLLSSQGSIPISSLASKVNVGLRRLEQKFSAQVGIRMKYFARIVRIRAAAEAMRTDSESKLGNIAYDHNFFDQAHFTREFRHFAGMTPLEYAQAIKGKASIYEMEILNNA
jgi:AraC-like DNA-binding protein